MQIQPPSINATPRRPRIALYSHDTMGLGHMRRNLLLAETLCGPPLNAAVLMIAGAREAAAFPVSPGIDCVTLPALLKDGEGTYGCRHLPLSLAEIVTLRGAAAKATLEAFEPDLFIVDNVPRGAVRELDATLRALSATGRTRIVLGLRDILDEPEVVRAEWRRAQNEEAIRDYYDAIWVYGDPLVCDPASEYHFDPSVASLMRFAGYLDQRRRLDSCGDSEYAQIQNLNLPPGPLVLGLVGGGQDGMRLADAFSLAELPPDATALLLTGPFMPPSVQRTLLDRAAANPRLRVAEFVTEPTLLFKRAHRIVAMGGYGTTCEILSFEKHALIVPRVTPRREQYIRASRLAALGLVETLHPDQVTPERISAWLAKDLGAPPPSRSLLDFQGLSRLPSLVADLIATEKFPALPRSEAVRAHVA